MTEITVESTRPTIDWFHIESKEVDVSEWYLTMQYRCGMWFLMHWKIEDGKKKNHYWNDFEISKPYSGIKELLPHVREFSDLHGCQDTVFQKELMKVLSQLKE